MKSRVFAAGAVAALLVACGGDDDSGGDGPQDQVADELLTMANDEGVDVDEDCVRDSAGELSDGDAEAVLEALDNASALTDVSTDAIGALGSLLDCVDLGSILDDIGSNLSDVSIPDVSIPDISLPEDLDIDQILDELEGEGIDTDCLRDALGDVDASTADPQELMTAAFECVDIGG